MADRNPLWVSHAGGVVTIDDARIGISALWTPGSSNVNARKGLRPGGTTAVTTPGFVAQQTVADKTVKVNAFQAAIPMSRATGSFIVTMDAAKNIDLLTAHPAHATLQRNDLIVAQVSDETVDAANGFSVVQIVGTPNASPSDPTVNITNGAPTNSPDYITLARVRVTANANTITTAMIDDLRPPWLVAAGGVLPILNATDRGTLTPYDGMAIWRIDRQWIEVYSIAAAGWLVQGVAQCTTTGDLAAITTPLTNQLAMVAADHCVYRYNGSAWAKHLTGNRTLSVNATGTVQTVTTTVADLAGAVLPFTSAASSFTADVTGYFDVDSTNASDIFIGTLQVDGVNQTGECHYAGVGRATVSLMWPVTFSSAGAHSMKLQVQKVNNAGTLEVNTNGHSRLVAKIYDL